MTRILTIEICGMEFEVEVEYEEEYPKCGITDVLSVSGIMKNSLPVALKCDRKRFLKDLEGDLQEALEEELITDKIAYAEMQMDAAREEGRL
jgi:hypothetical protein